MQSTENLVSPDFFQVLKAKLYSSNQESYSPSQCQLNMALKYQEKEGSIWVSIFRCKFRVNFFSRFYF